MHPINKNNFGPTGIPVKFNNGTGVVTGYIVKQTGTSKFKVTDGTVTLYAKLARTSSDAQNLPTGVCTIPATITPTGVGASFSVLYAVATATPVAAGSNYVTNDTITLSNGVTATVTATSGSVTAITVTNPSATYITINGTSAMVPTTTSGSGTGLTVNVKWKVSSISVSGGHHYVSGSSLVFTGITATTSPVATIGTVTNGTPSTVTVGSAGSGITVDPTAITTASSVEHVYRITDNVFQTVEGGKYSWTVSGSAITATPVS